VTKFISINDVDDNEWMLNVEKITFIRISNADNADDADETHVEGRNRVSIDMGDATVNTVVNDDNYAVLRTLIVT